MAVIIVRLTKEETVTRLYRVFFLCSFHSVSLRLPPSLVSSTPHKRVSFAYSAFLFCFSFFLFIFGIFILTRKRNEKRDTVRQLPPSAPPICISTIIPLFLSPSLVHNTVHNQIVCTSVMSSRISTLSMFPCSIKYHPNDEVTCLFLQCPRRVYVCVCVCNL